MTHTMSFYVNGCQYINSYRFHHVPSPGIHSTHWAPNMAVRSRSRRTTSLRSVSKGEWKVLELCTFCLLQKRRTWRSYRGHWCFAETMLVPGRKKHRTFDPLPSETYSPPKNSAPNYQSLKKSLRTNNPETRGMYE